MNCLKYFWVLVMAQVMLPMDAAQAGPITFNSALPLSEGVGILGSQVTLLHKAGDTTALQRNLNVTMIPLLLAYGVNGKIALFGVLPYVDKRMDITIGANRVRRQSKGLGDAKFFVRYTVYQQDSLGDTLRIAPFVGLKMPTGISNKRDGFGVLPRPLQSGSGSWDSFAGMTMTRQTLDWEFDSAVSYQANTAANDFEFGDEARLDSSFQYRILPNSLDDVGVPAFIYAVLESNLIWNGKDKLASATNINSGGTTWNIVSGLQYVTRRYVLETAVLIPVIQQLNGTALETDWAWTAGFRWNF